jgi:hypothetical protein
MSSRCSIACFVFLSIVLGSAAASAAETGTKTMPSSSIYPPPTRPIIFGTYQHYDCYLPSEPCGNRHRVTN